MRKWLSEGRKMALSTVAACTYYYDQFKRLT